MCVMMVIVSCVFTNKVNNTKTVNLSLPFLSCFINIYYYCILFFSLTKSNQFISKMNQMDQFNFILLHF